ncbi:MAG: AAA family ATPase [Anaerolineaceae bacterium]|nr:AAA family ATPase [Anaerolineaceae bacterium]
MYLSSLELNNFRCFGEKQVIEFNNGLNILVGENDSGKSAIIDAIRIVLGTTDQSWYRTELSDFYDEDINREIRIVCKFSNLSVDEQAAFLECLSYETQDDVQVPCLYLHWTCKLLLKFSPPRTSPAFSTGKNGDGPTPAPEAKELLRATYLRPLRDAYSNMQSGRNSRLSQIMIGLPGLNDGRSVYSKGDDLEELSLTGIADLLNYLLANHKNLKSANDEITSIMKDKMLLAGDKVATNFEVSGTDASETRKITSLLEKLDLSIQNAAGKGRVGLGTSNVLSMACELLLNRDSNSSFLLIEEPEAHIHAQRQLRLIQALQDSANDPKFNREIIITTHSPLLTSVVNLENITVMKNNKPYPMSKKHTKLDAQDYVFLERYLDATKANLFFARSVLIVEGPSEELLLPTISRLLNKDLTKHGVSIVNVMSTGLRRYARIFQRVNEISQLPIPVACITDRDIMPDCAPGICIDTKFEDVNDWPEKRKRRWKTESDLDAQEKELHLEEICEKSDGQFVKTFVSDYWTFEYDLAMSGLDEELAEAIVKIKHLPKDQENKLKQLKEKTDGYKTKEEKASYLYSWFTKLSVSKAEVAQQLAIIIENKYKNDNGDFKQKIPPYILKAIEYVTEED